MLIVNSLPYYKHRNITSFAAKFQLKKFLKILFFVSIIAIIVAGGFTFYFYKNVKPILIEELNKRLAVEVKVNEIKLASFKEFPKIGITLNNVIIDESSPFYGQSLLEAKQLSLFLDVLKLTKKEYIIDAITIDNGILNVADLIGASNYDITKPSKSKVESEISFGIKKLVLKNCKLTYTHVPSNFVFSSYAPKSKVSIKYTLDKTDVSIKSIFDSTNIAYDNENYVNNKRLNVNTSITVNSATELVIIQPSNLAIEKIELNVKGRVNYSKRSSLNIAFEGNKTTAKHVLSVLPPSFNSSVSHIQLGGDVGLKGFIKGMTYKGKSPSFGLDFLLENGNLGVKGQKLRLDGIDTEGDVVLPNISDFKTARVILKIKNATSKNNSIDGNLQINNFEEPQINWQGKANLDAPFLTSLAGNSGFKATNGNISLEGNLKLSYDLQKQGLKDNSLEYNGKITVDKFVGQLQNPQLDVKELNANLSADLNKIIINSCDFLYNNTSGELMGYITNYANLTSKNNNTELVGKLKVNNLNVNELIPPASSNNGAISEHTTTDIIPIKLKLKAELNSFTYNDFIAEQMIGNLVSNRKKINMPSCKIKALSGNTTANLILKKWGANYLLDINADVKNVDITEMLKQFNNFEQNEITSENLSGRLTGTILTKVILDGNYEPVLPKLYAKANLTLENGQLKNYEPLQELSAFVKIEDLRNVKFKTLKNTIEIFDQTIFIPKMRIENSALNLELAGSHTFENYMQYNISLSVAELLAKQANWLAKRRAEIVQNNDQKGLTAHIIMEGTPNDLNFMYDKATLKKSVKEELKEEKKNFIKALKGEATLEKETSETKNYDDVWDE